MMGWFDVSRVFCLFLRHCVVLLEIEIERIRVVVAINHPWLFVKFQLAAVQKSRGN